MSADELSKTSSSGSESSPTTEVTPKLRKASFKTVQPGYHMLLSLSSCRVIVSYVCVQCGKLLLDLKTHDFKPPTRKSMGASQYVHHHFL